MEVHIAYKVFLLPNTYNSFPFDFNFEFFEGKNEKEGGRERERLLRR